METLNYEIIINAPIQKVWETLWNEETYTKWTQYFSPESRMETDWKIGGKTYFLDANGNGIISTILSLEQPFEVVFSHLGTIKNGIVDTLSKEVEQWSGAKEQYFLRSIDENKTEVRAITHVEQEYQEMMNIAFTKGFQELKNLAED